MGHSFLLQRMDSLDVGDTGRTDNVDLGGRIDQVHLPVDLIR